MKDLRHACVRASEHADDAQSLSGYRPLLGREGNTHSISNRHLMKQGIINTSHSLVAFLSPSIEKKFQKRNLQKKENVLM
jgi:hypothetical protein